MSNTKIGEKRAVKGMTFFKQEEWRNIEWSVYPGSATTSDMGALLSFVNILCILDLSEKRWV